MTSFTQKSAWKRWTLTISAAVVLAALGLAAWGIVARGEALTRATEAVHQAATVVRPHHKAAPLLPAVAQKDIRANHQKLADETLRALPAGCRNNLKNFYVNYDKNAANRGLGGASTIIIIGTVPDAEFRALLVHECAHVIDIGALKGAKDSGFSAFMDGKNPVYQNDPSVAFYQISWLAENMQQPGTKSTDFVSGYAASDPFEDFAESFAFYALQPKEFARLAQTNTVLKAKYEFMRDLVFSATEQFAQGKFVRSKAVPWDVTKLPYVWHAKK